jgi:hypothetical protein
LISLDTETTGLDPAQHEVWEVALVDTESTDEWWFEFPVRDLAAADPGALRINDYYARCSVPSGFSIAQGTGPGVPSTPDVQDDDGQMGYAPERLAFIVARVTADATLLGCNVAWDAQMVAKLLRSYGQAPAWKHRFLELGSYAAGPLNKRRPLSTNELSKRFGEPDDVHTALSDARWNVSVYRNLMAQRRLQREESRG